MSRLIIKNIDTNFDSLYFLRLFSSYGNVTDIKMFKDCHGSTKNFCFVGFATFESAMSAMENLNGTLIGNKTITIEKALPRCEKQLLYHNEVKSKKIILNDKLSNRFDENIAMTGTLCIKNIAVTCKISELELVLRNFGYIDSINIPNVQKLNAFSNHAFIKFGLPECAISAAACLDGKIFQGKILHIVFCNNTINSLVSKTNTRFNNYQNIKKQLVFEKFNNHKSWFSLFIPEYLVFKNLMSKYGREKYLVSCYQQLKLNRGQSIITEGRIQNEAFLILKREGLNLNIFNPTKIEYKSKKALLIKNISIEKRKTLNLLTSNLENIVKYVVLPLTGLTLIELKTKSDAIVAYKKLEKLSQTSKQFLVQWAPLNCIDHKLNIKPYKNQFEKKSLKNENKNIHSKMNKVQKSFLNVINTETNFNSIPSKLLIRNIPFSLNLKNLKKAFINIGNILKIKLPKKKNGTNRGFCFVQFSSLDAVKKALVLLQNVHLEKRHLSCCVVK